MDFIWSFNRSIVFMTLLVFGLYVITNINNQTYIDINFESVSETQQMRKKILSQFCEDYYKDKKKPTLEEFLSKMDMARVKINNHYKYAECTNAKTGTTTRSSYFYKANHNNESMQLSFHEENLKKVHSFHYMRDKSVPSLISINNMSNKVEIMQNYYTFLFVREPIERVLSAYYNLVVDKHIKKHNFDRDSRNGTQFLAQLANLIKENIPLEDHFGTIFDRCNPCVINYNYIGHQETMNKDLLYIVNEVPGLKDVVQKSPDFYQRSSMRKSPKPEYHLIPEEMRVIIKYFEADFSAFGYEFSNYTKGN